MKNRLIVSVAMIAAGVLGLVATSPAAAYNYPRDDGKSITTTASTQAEGGATVDAVLCKDKRQFFNAVVFVKFVDRGNNTLGYSSNFSFSVQAFNPYPTPVNTQAWRDWNNLWNKQSTDPRWPGVYTTQVHTITTTSGAQRTHGPGPVNIPRPIHNCSPPSINDRGKRESAYAFRSGQDGTYQLSCQGDLSRYSSGFIFRTKGEPTDRPAGVARNVSGRYKQATYEAVPFDYNETGTGGNLQINDLNRAYMAIEFKYELDIASPPEFKLEPSIKTGTTHVIDGESTRVTGIEARVANEGPERSESSRTQISRFVVKRGDRNATIDTRLSQASGSTSSNANTAVRTHIEGAYFRGRDYADIPISGANPRTFNKGTVSVLSNGTDDRLGGVSLEIGDRLCYMTSVSRPTHSDNDTVWRHSAPACLTVGVRPHMQVRSGDVMIGGHIITGRTDRQTGSERRSYGSWAEYGAVAGRGISPNFGSGSVYRMGLANGHANNQFLSFANTPLSAAGNYGSVDSGAGTLTSFFSDQERTQTINANQTLNVGSLRGKNVVRAMGNVNVQGDLQPGTSVVVQVPANSTARINGNITTPNEYAAVGDISQLVIAPAGTANANFNIHIAPGVTRVDAWLLAPGGRVDTCNDRTSIGTRTAPYRGEGGCQNNLFINGPVAANGVLLGRTGGQDRVEGQNRQSTPAENFNLRPDAYLWIANQVNTSGTRYVTTQTLDLPPRF